MHYRKVAVARAWPAAPSARNVVHHILSMCSHSMWHLCFSLLDEVWIVIDKRLLWYMKAGAAQGVAIVAYWHRAESDDDVVLQFVGAIQCNTTTQCSRVPCLLFCLGVLGT